ncbi:uncharacterized protein LOC122498248 [Leptopilina heterotoma]|uniref:uncharacterized protein LOC122498248 n=1 Tax=Leptopilina heterotoma TaxID=63436 RepID=UPI001CA9C9D4|nr:uncharacterized protein LOC122498248 [Leptopilina heterotoma]
MKIKFTVYFIFAANFLFSSILTDGGIYVHNVTHESVKFAWNGEDKFTYLIIVHDITNMKSKHTFEINESRSYMQYVIVNLNPECKYVLEILGYNDEGDVRRFLSKEITTASLPVKAAKRRRIHRVSYKD